MEAAAKEGLFDTIRFLSSHRTEPFGVKPLEAAAKGGHIEVVHCLCHNPTVLQCSDWAFAGSVKHPQVFQFLVSHFPSDFERMDIQRLMYLTNACDRDPQTLVQVLDILVQMKVQRLQINEQLAINMKDFLAIVIRHNYHICLIRTFETFDLTNLLLPALHLSIQYGQLHLVRYFLNAFRKDQ
ncbi:hypothetical protein SAMD00019534_117010 [Acytostelium subglobosum LB1]|uniref:hypothetical protein n=1 Tax=Acytostelium subglobosum LB1 TaxID=1410327 RepID=UPI000644DD69|nr:hypothetical protein SAMD00019534_117010 [Acytostelium subglobosum LB1]GAM28525.1 hypothetical protein SAMD00019534_117010 [Acytostelium subglobosum LB1]|eukprot:XP_012748564.1 hypothetical protein SAMD00019534_117010 [Acytostelium subglobosum LB1]